MLTKIITFLNRFSPEIEFLYRENFLHAIVFVLLGKTKKFIISFLTTFRVVGFKDKHPNKIYLHEHLQKYWINFLEHSEHYDVYNSTEIVSEFLTVFENNFVSKSNLSKIRLKCTFTIVNQQLLLAVGFAETTTSARVCITNVYKGVDFNEFVKANLADDIWKRIILNGMSGSSWRFKELVLL